MQHRALTSSVGLNILTHKTYVYVEAGILALELARKNNQTWRRIQVTPIQFYSERKDTKKTTRRKEKSFVKELQNI